MLFDHFALCRARRRGRTSTRCEPRGRGGATSSARLGWSSTAARSAQDHEKIINCKFPIASRVRIFSWSCGWSSTAARSARPVRPCHGLITTAPSAARPRAAAGSARLAAWMGASLRLPGRAACVSACACAGVRTVYKVRCVRVCARARACVRACPYPPAFVPAGAGGTAGSTRLARGRTAQTRMLIGCRCRGNTRTTKYAPLRLLHTPHALVQTAKRALFTPQPPTTPPPTAPSCHLPSPAPAAPRRWCSCRTVRG